MRNLANNVVLGVMAAVLLFVGDSAFGQYRPMEYKLPKDIDVSVPWLAIIGLILTLAVLCTCAFKKARRTHID